MCHNLLYVRHGDLSIDRSGHRKFFGHQLWTLWETCLDRCRTWVAGNCVTKGCKRSGDVGLSTDPVQSTSAENRGLVETKTLKRWYRFNASDMVHGSHRVAILGPRWSPVAISIIVQPTLQTSARLQPLSVCCSLITSGAIHKVCLLHPCVCRICAYTLRRSKVCDFCNAFVRYQHVSSLNITVSNTISMQVLQSKKQLSSINSN